MKLAIATMFAASILPSAASAQYTVTVRPDPFWSSYYAARGFDSGPSFGWGDLAIQYQRQGLINSYRQAHGLPKCSAYPVIHWDGLPAC